MKNDVISNKCDDEDEKNGRILNEDEFIQALKNRDDIFLIEKENRLRGIEMITFVIGMVLGLWLNTLPSVNIAPDFYQKILETRTAKLIHGQGFSVIKEPTDEKTFKMEENRKDKKISVKAFTVELDTSYYKIPPRKSTIRSAEAGFQSIRYSIKTSDGAHLKTYTHAPESITYNRQQHLDIEKSSIEDTDLIIQGTTNKMQQNYGKAIEYFRRVLDKDPRNTTALSGLGDTYLYAGLLDSASAIYNAAIAVNPRIATVHNGLGTVHYYDAISPEFNSENRALKKSSAFIKSQYDSAIAEYTNAISLDSTFVEALVNRGLVRGFYSDTDGAIKDYTLAIKIKPSSADAYVKRAATYKSLRKFKEAFEDYTAAILSDSSSYNFNPTLHFANTYFGRGNVYYQIGEFEKAIADYNSSLKLSPNHSLAILNKARALGGAKQYDSAIVCYTQAIALLSPLEYNGAQEHAYFGRGLIYNLTYQFDKALIDFNNALKLKPNDYYAYLHRGNTEKAQNRLDEAIADYSSALELPKIAAKSCWRIAECYALKKDRTNALKWLKKAVSFGFNDFVTWEYDRDLSFLWNDKEFIEITTQQ